jgi:hypothetical protein
MKRYQAVVTAEEVQILSERATMQLLIFGDAIEISTLCI